MIFVATEIVISACAGISLKLKTFEPPVLVLRILKEWRPHLLDVVSILLVAGEGLEPPTFGL